MNKQKTVFRLMAVVICMTMLLTFASCGGASPAEQLLGTWETLQGGTTITHTYDGSKISVVYKNANGKEFSRSELAYVVESDNMLKAQLNDTFWREYTYGEQAKSDSGYWYVDGNTLYLHNLEWTRQ